jgi:hypothetical protein
MQERQPDARQFAKLAASIQAILRWEQPARGAKGEEGQTGLSAEAKNAFIHLALAAGGVNRSWMTHAGTLAAAIGAKDGRSGRSALDKLESEGLIERNRFKGDVSIFLKDPLEVAIARRTRAASDSDQRELEFPEDQQSPSEDAGGPSAAATLPMGPATPASDAHYKPACDVHHKPPQHRTSARARLETSNIKHLSPDEDVRCSSGLSCTSQAASSRADRERAEIASELERLARKTRPADAPGAEAPLGKALAESLGKIEEAAVNPTGQVNQSQKWLAYVKTRVNDHQLGKFKDGRLSMGGEQMLMRIAWAVAAGELPKVRLESALQALDWYCRHKQVASRAAYFIGIMKNIFLELGLEWTKRKGAGDASAD